MIEELKKEDNAFVLNEVRRIYCFPEEVTVEITGCVLLLTSPEGHKLVDSNGDFHVVPHGWLYLNIQKTEDPSQDAIMCGGCTDCCGGGYVN